MVADYSDEEEFAAVASDDQSVMFFCLNLSNFLRFIYYSIDLCTSDDESTESHQDGNRGKKNIVLVQKGKLRKISARKNANEELEGDEV